jgi:hypothetical protein
MSLASRAKLRACRAAVAAALLVGLPAAAAAAEPSKPDLWQTYQSAADAAIRNGDYEIAAVLLHSATAMAEAAKASATSASDAAELRVALSRMPLILTYRQIDKTDLAKQLGDKYAKDIAITNALLQKAGTIDKTLAAFIPTARGMSQNFDALAIDNSESDEGNLAELYGVVEIFLRERFSADDDQSMGDAKASLAAMISRRDAKRALKAFDDSDSVWNAMQQRRTSLAAVDRTFSASGEAIPDLAPMSLEQVNSSVIATSNVLKGLDSDDYTDAVTKLRRASDYLSTLQLSLDQIHKVWPNNPIFGSIDMWLGQLHAYEFKLNKADASKFPEAFEQAKASFDHCFRIYDHALGPGSAKNCAQAYANLLRDAGKPEEAANLEKRYKAP